jgi:hypothetical protein
MRGFEGIRPTKRRTIANNPYAVPHHRLCGFSIASFALKTSDCKTVQHKHGLARQFLRCFETAPIERNGGAARFFPMDASCDVRCASSRAAVAAAGSPPRSASKIDDQVFPWRGISSLSRSPGMQAPPSGKPVDPAAPSPGSLTRQICKFNVTLNRPVRMPVPGI